MRRYTIGVDYGSLSARGVLADIENGEITAQAEYVYPHATMDPVRPEVKPAIDECRSAYLFAGRHPIGGGLGAAASCGL